MPATGRLPCMGLFSIFAFIAGLKYGVGSTSVLYLKDKLYLPGELIGHAPAAQENQQPEHVYASLFRRPDDGLDRLFEKLRPGQGLATVKNVVQYRLQYLKIFLRRIAKPSVVWCASGHRIVEASTTLTYAALLARTQPALSGRSRPSPIRLSAAMMLAIARAGTARWKTHYSGSSSLSTRTGISTSGTRASSCPR